jgi:hypothetical protein
LGILLDAPLLLRETDMRILFSIAKHPLTLHLILFLAMELLLTLLRGGCFHC